MLTEEDFRGATLADAPPSPRSPTRRNKFLLQETKVYKEEVLLMWNIYRRLNDAVQNRREFNLYGGLQLIQNIFETIRFEYGMLVSGILVLYVFFFKECVTVTSFIVCATVLEMLR